MTDPPLDAAGEHAAALRTPRHAAGPGKPGEVPRNVTWQKETTGSTGARVLAQEKAQETGHQPVRQPTNAADSSNNESDSEGFVTVQAHSKAKRERRTERKAETKASATTSGRGRPASSTGRPREGRGQWSPVRKHQGARTQQDTPPRKQYTPLERLFFRLRDYVRNNVESQRLVEIIARMQRILRTKDEEDKREFTRVYDENNPNDMDHLCSMIREMIGVKRITLEELIKGFDNFGLVATLSEPKTKSTFSWTDRLQGGENTQKQPQVTYQPPQTVWKNTKRELDKNEAEALVTLLKGDPKQMSSLEALKETHGVHAHALLTSLAQDTTTVTLVVQLNGHLRLPDNITYFGRDRQLSDDSGLTNLNDEFRGDTTISYYEAISNRLYFVMKSSDIADKWINQQITVQQRLMTLLKLRPNGTELQEGSVAKDEYEFNLIVPSGRLAQIQLIHLLAGILKMSVKYLQPAAPASGQPFDPTVFKVVVTSVGCPVQIREKTGIKWHDETLWIFHQVFHPVPPCTTCAHPSHMARGCPPKKENNEKFILHLTQPLLDTEDTKKEIQRIQGPALTEWIERTVAQQQERSLMGGEDVDAAPPPPGAPSGGRTVYVMPKERYRIRRAQYVTRHYENLQIAGKIDFWRQQVTERPEWEHEVHALRIPDPEIVEKAEVTIAKKQRIARCLGPVEVLDPEQRLSDQRALAKAAKLAQQSRERIATASYDKKPGIMITQHGFGTRYVLTTEISRTKILKQLEGVGKSEEELKQAADQAKKVAEVARKEAAAARKAVKDAAKEVKKQQATRLTVEEGARQPTEPTIGQPVFPTRTFELRTKQDSCQTDGASRKDHDKQRAEQSQLPIMIDPAGRGGRQALPPVPGGGTSAAPTTTPTGKAIESDSEEDDSMDELDEYYMQSVTARKQSHAADAVQQPQRYFSVFGTGTTQRTAGQRSHQVGSETESKDQHSDEDRSSPAPARWNSEFEEKQDGPPFHTPPASTQVHFHAVHGAHARREPANEQPQQGRASKADMRRHSGTARTLFAPLSPAKAAREARRSSSPRRRSSLPYLLHDTASTFEQWDCGVWSEPSITPSPSMQPPSFELLGRGPEVNSDMDVNMMQTDEAPTGRVIREARPDGEEQDSVEMNTQDAPATPDVQFLEVRQPDTEKEDGHRLHVVADYERCFQARQVAVAGDGCCWVRSVYGATTGEIIGDTLEADDSKVNDHIAYYNKKIHGTLQSNLQGLIDNHTLSWSELFKEFFQQDPPEDERLVETMVRKRIAIGARIRAGGVVPTELWASTSIVLATALYLRQPLLVVDVGPQGQAHAQLHYLEPSKLSIVEQIKTQLLSAAEAHRFMQSHFAAHTLPLVFFRSYDPDQTRSTEHFTCLRYEQQLYMEWGTDAPDGTTMRDRMDRVYEALGLPIISQASLSVDNTPPEDFDDVSYEPSEPSEEGASDASPVRTRAATIGPEEYIGLLRALPLAGNTVSTNPAWYQAVNTNEQAFVRWKTTRLTELPAAVTRPETNLRSACHLVNVYSHELIDLVQSLPYPEVQLARIDATRLARLGKFCIRQAAAQTLREFCAHSPEHQSVEQVTRWIDKLETDSTVQTWRLVTSSTKWEKLSLQKYGMPMVSEREWSHVTAILMCMTGSLPDEWRRLPFTRRCHNLQEWLRADINQERVEALIESISRGDWSTVATTLSPSYPGLSSTSELASTLLVDPDCTGEAREAVVPARQC